MIWRQRVELMEVLRAPAVVAELVTIKHLGSHTAVATPNVVLGVYLYYIWEQSPRKQSKYLVNQSINWLVMSSCKSLHCQTSHEYYCFTVKELNTALYSFRLMLGKNNRSNVNVLALAVIREPRGGTEWTPGALRIKRVQSGLVWATQTTTHSTHSPSQQGPAIWIHFCSDRVALKAHLYEGYTHSGPQECACLGGLSRFKGWRHNAIYLFTLYTGASHFINICISFLVPWSILGSLSLDLGTKKPPK